MNLHRLPVTLLHGGPAAPWSLGPLDRALRARGARVSYPRYACCGMGDLGRGVDQVLTASGGQPGVVVAHSLGGYVALRTVASGARPIALVGLAPAWRGVDSRLPLPSLRTARGPQPVPHVDCPVISVVIPGDRQVPEWSSQLGHVIQAPWLSHGGLARATGLVMEALRSLESVGGS